MADENSNVSSSTALSFVCGFLVGLTAGAAVAIILAPQSGADTRSLIRNRATDTYGSIGKRVQEVKQMAADLAGDLKEDVGEWAQRTKEKIAPIVKEARNKVEGAMNKEGGSVSTN